MMQQKRGAFERAFCSEADQKFGEEMRQKQKELICTVFPEYGEEVVDVDFFTIAKRNETDTMITREDFDEIKDLKK